MFHALLTTDWHLGIRLSGPLKFRFILQRWRTEPTVRRRRPADSSR